MVEEKYFQDKLLLKTKSSNKLKSIQEDKTGAYSNFKVTSNDFYATGFKANTDRGIERVSTSNSKKYKYNNLFQVNADDVENDCLVIKY